MSRFHALVAFEVLMIVAALIVASNLGAIAHHLAGDLPPPTMDTRLLCFPYGQARC